MKFNKETLKSIPGLVEIFKTSKSTYREMLSVLEVEDLKTLKIEAKRKYDETVDELDIEVIRILLKDQGVSFDEKMPESDVRYIFNALSFKKKKDNDIENKMKKYLNDNNKYKGYQKLASYKRFRDRFDKATLEEKKYALKLVKMGEDFDYINNQQMFWPINTLDDFLQKIPNYQDDWRIGILIERFYKSKRNNQNYAIDMLRFSKKSKEDTIVDLLTNEVFWPYDKYEEEWMDIDIVLAYRNIADSYIDSEKKSLLTSNLKTMFLDFRSGSEILKSKQLETLIKRYKKLRDNSYDFENFYLDYDIINNINEEELFQDLLSDNARS